MLGAVEVRPQQPRQKDVLLVCSADTNKLNFGGTQLGHSCLHTRPHTDTHTLLEAGFAVSDEPSEHDQKQQSTAEETHTPTHLEQKNKKIKSITHTHQQNYFISLGI